MGNSDANHDATKDVSNDAGKDKHRFKSIGTIRVPITKQDGDKQERFIYFTPIDAYSVKHEGKTTAGYSHLADTHLIDAAEKVGEILAPHRCRFRAVFPFFLRWERVSLPLYPPLPVSLVLQESALMATPESQGARSTPAFHTCNST